MKKASKLLFLVLMLVVALFAVTACPAPGPDNNDPVASSIRIETLPMQQTFVQGQELNLDGGVLIAVEDGNEIPMSLNDPRITITGYDSQALGQQQITLSYGGQSANLLIVVTKRIAIDNAVIDEYFVGEQFDRSSGNITVTDDEGKATQVSINDSRVTLSGIDTFSASAGEKTITVNFGNYSDTFKVSVYDVASSEMVFSGNTSYSSHDEEMLLKDSYMTLTAANGFTRKVFLTSDMIANGTFNPYYFEYSNGTDVIPDNYSERTSANGTYYERDQKVDFTYASVTKSVNVTFRYTDVSLIRRYAEILSRPVADGGVDYANIGNIVNGVAGYEFTPDQLEMATAAAEIFLDFDMTKEDEAEMRNLITDDVLECFLPVATYSYYVDWFEGFVGNEENDGFGEFIELMLTPSADGLGYQVIVNLVGDTYEKAKASYAALTSGATGTEFAELSRKNSYLWRILGDNELSFKTFYTQANGNVVTLAAGCAYAVKQADILYQIEVFEHLIKLYEMFHNDENNITYSALLDGTLTEEQLAVIPAVYSEIEKNLMLFNGDRSIYSILSTWGDGYFFDVLFQYYYDLAIEEMRKNPTHNDWATNQHLLTLAFLGSYTCMPADIENFYIYAYYVYRTYYTFNQQGGVIDATELFVYYDGVLSMIEYFDTVKADGSLDGSDDNSDVRKASRLLSKNLMEVMEFNFFPYVSVDEVNPETGEIYQAPSPRSVDEILYGFRYNYLYLTAGMYDVAQFENIVDDYLSFIGGYFNGDYYDTIDNGDGTSMQAWSDKFFAAVPAFMEKFISYSPDMQSAFLLTLTNSPLRMFDMSQENSYAYFGALLLSYHDAMKAENNTVVTYGDKEYDVFAQMLLAYETYLRVGTIADINGATNYLIEDFFGYFRDGYNVYDSEGIEVIDTIPSVTMLWEYLDLDSFDASYRGMLETLYNYLNKLTEMYSYDGSTYIGSSFDDYSNWGTEDGETEEYWEARFNGFADELGKYFMTYLGGEVSAIVPYLSYTLHIDNEYNKLLEEINALDNEALKADLIEIMSYARFDVLGGRYKNDKHVFDYLDIDFLLTIDAAYNSYRSNYAYILYTYSVFGSQVFGDARQGYEYLFYHWDEDLMALFESAAEIMLAWTEVTLSDPDLQLFDLSVASSASVRDIAGADEFFKTYLSMDELTSAQKAIFRELNYYPVIFTNGAVSDYFEMTFSYYYLNKLGYDTTQSGNWNQSGEEYAMYFAIRYFINVVNSYVDYDYYTERYDEFNELDVNFRAFYNDEIKSLYQTNLYSFNIYFGRLTEDQKTMFRAEFGEDLINEYLTNPGRQA